MNRVNVVLMGAVLTLAPAVQAQQEVGQSQMEPQSVPVPYKASRAGDPLQIDVPERYRSMWARDYDDYGGAYTLANGQTLSIAPKGMHMYARVDDGQWHRIVVAASNTFVALDRQLKMEINRLGDDQVGGWVTMVVPPEKLANGALSPERVVRLAMR